MVRWVLALCLIVTGVVPALACRGKIGRWDWDREADGSYSVSTLVDVGQGMEGILDAGIFQFSFNGHDTPYATLASVDNSVTKLSFAVDGKPQVEITENDKGQWDGQRYTSTIAALRSGREVTMSYLVAGKTFNVNFTGTEFSQAYTASQTLCQ